MSQENVRAFEQLIEAGNRADVEDAVRRSSEDIVFIAARSAVEGVHHGHDGLRRFFADSAENFEVFRVDLAELRDLGDRVLAVGTIHVRGQGSGIETDLPMAGIADFEDGKLTR